MKNIDLDNIKRNKPIQELLNFSFINIDKPLGPTSFQISQFIKNSLNLRKTSHLGTLDPTIVSGVLPVALNRACRLNEYLMHKDKTYVGIIRIHKDIQEDKLKKEMSKFVGRIKQLPPIKSRVKRQIREREVKSFKILERGGKDVLFEAEVQAGTYIRKLCLPKDAEIIVNGSIKQIADLKYEKSLGQTTVGFYKENFNDFLIKNKQKINSPQKIMIIKTESGIPLRLTEEHPILLLRKNRGKEYIEAEKIKEGDKIISVSKINISPKTFDFLESLDNNFLINGPGLKELCVKELIEKFGSIREVARRFKIDRKQFNTKGGIWLRKKYVRLTEKWQELKNLVIEVKTEKGIRFNMKDLKFDRELAYLLGLIASDGCVVFEKKNTRPTRIKFHNNEKKLINNFFEIHKKKFSNFKCIIKKIKNKLFEIDAYNPILANICYTLGIISPESRSDFKKIFELKEEIIAGFLKGYFDGDGNAYFKLKKENKGAYSNIEYATSNFIIAKRILLLLKRLGINARIYEKQNLGGFHSKINLIYIVRLKNIQDKIKFIDLIGTNHPKKSDYLIKIKNYFKNHKLTEKPFTTEKVLEVFSVDYKEDFVYDLTVAKAHNFLAEGNFVVSNCHNLGENIGGAHMLELRRTKAGIFSEEDKKYPAVNLYEFEKAIKEYKEGKEEKLRKIIIPAEIVSELYPIVQIEKKFVDKILHGSPIYYEHLKNTKDKENEGKFCAFEEEKFIGVYKVTAEEKIFARPEFVLQPVDEKK